MITRCLRSACNGRIYRDEFGDERCLWCGREPNPIDPLPLVRNVKYQGPAFGEPYRKKKRKKKALARAT